MAGEGSGSRNRGDVFGGLYPEVEEATTVLQKECGALLQAQCADIAFFVLCDVVRINVQDRYSVFVDVNVPQWNACGAEGDMFIAFEKQLKRGTAMLVQIASHDYKGFATVLGYENGILEMKMCRSSGVKLVKNGIEKANLRGMVKIKVHMFGVLQKRLSIAIDKILSTRCESTAKLAASILLGVPAASIVYPALEQDLSVIGYVKLNESQNEAVKHALEHQVSMIQGPPGTGKTHVAATIVSRVLAEPSLSAAERRQKDHWVVLCCAPSNKATDRLCEQVNAAGVQCLRIYTESGYKPVVGVTFPVMNDILEEEIERNSTIKVLRKKLKEGQELDEKEKDRYSVLIANLKMSIFRRYKALAVTCITAASLPGNIGAYTVVVDEAGQCLEAESTIVAMKTKKRAVFIGDQMQLGPTVAANHLKQLEYGVLHRLVQNGYACNILRLQYRMHFHIAAFPMCRFYDGAVETDVSTNAYEAPRSRLWPKKIYSWFLNVTSHVEEMKGASYFNMGEVDAVRSLLLALVEGGYARRRICVISFYNAQVNELSRMVHEDERLIGIHVGSVDSFQGSESDIVVLSTVRCNGKQQVGFCCDKRRMNVALTRAKLGLVVVGSYYTLSGSELWNDYLVGIGDFAGIHCLVDGVLEVDERYKKKPDVLRSETATPRGNRLEVLDLEAGKAALGPECAGAEHLLDWFDVFLPIRMMGDSAEYMKACFEDGVDAQDENFENSLDFHVEAATRVMVKFGLPSLMETAVQVVRSDQMAEPIVELLADKGIVFVSVVVNRRAFTSFPAVISLFFPEKKSLFVFGIYDHGALPLLSLSRAWPLSSRVFVFPSAKIYAYCKRFARMFVRTPLFVDVIRRDMYERAVTCCLKHMAVQERFFEDLHKLRGAGETLSSHPYGVVNIRFNVYLMRLLVNVWNSNLMDVELTDRSTYSAARKCADERMSYKVGIPPVGLNKRHLNIVAEYVENFDGIVDGTKFGRIRDLIGLSYNYGKLYNLQPDILLSDEAIVQLLCAKDDEAIQVAIDIFAPCKTEFRNLVLKTLTEGDCCSKLECGICFRTGHIGLICPRTRTLARILRSGFCIAAELLQTERLVFRPTPEERERALELYGTKASRCVSFLTEPRVFTFTVWTDGGVTQYDIHEYICQLGTGVVIRFTPMFNTTAGYEQHNNVDQAVFGFFIMCCDYHIKENFVDVKEVRPLPANSYVIFEEIDVGVASRLFGKLYSGLSATYELDGEATK